MLRYLTHNQQYQTIVDRETAVENKGQEIEILGDKRYRMRMGVFQLALFAFPIAVPAIEEFLDSRTVRLTAVGKVTPGFLEQPCIRIGRTGIATDLPQTVGELFKTKDNLLHIGGIPRTLAQE